MTSKRFYWLMVSLLVLMVAALLGGAYGTQKLLQTKSRELVKLKASLAAYSNQQQGLVQAKKDIKTYNELYTIAKVVVPESKDQAQAIRQIVKIADNNSILLGKFSFPVSSLGQSSSKAGAPVNSPASLAPTPNTANSAGSTLSQLIPVPGSTGVYVLTIAVNSDTKHPTTFPHFISFLSELEQNRLTAEVTNVAIVPDANDPTKFTFTLNLNTYIKP